MFTPVYTKQFARDVKKAQKRSKNLEKFKIIATSLLHGETLDEIHRDHKLLGNYSGRRECHIESDWLLIFVEPDSHLARCGPGTPASDS
jgi:mRNA interferase YafQ